MGPRPLKDLEVPVSGRPCARLLAPGAPLGPRPLEDLEMPILCSCHARHIVPGVPVGPRPLQDREVPASCPYIAERLRKPFRRLGRGKLDIALGGLDQNSP